MSTEIKDMMDNVEKGMKEENTEPFRTYEGWMDSIEEYVKSIVKGKDKVNNQRGISNDSYYNVKKDVDGSYFSQTGPSDISDSTNSSSNSSFSTSSSSNTTSSSSNSFFSFLGSSTNSKFKNTVLKEKRKSEWLV
jgi:uncharacterized protein YaaR (DUF327 family)